MKHKLSIELKHNSEYKMNTEITNPSFPTSAEPSIEEISGNNFKNFIKEKVSRPEVSHDFIQQIINNTINK